MSGIVFLEVEASEKAREVIAHLKTDLPVGYINDVGDGRFEAYFKAGSNSEARQMLEGALAALGGEAESLVRIIYPHAEQPGSKAQGRPA